MTLHEAMERVLADHPGGLSASDIAWEIGRLGLFTRPSDGMPPPPSQIRARANNYPRLFVYDSGKIRLLRSSSNKPSPQARVRDAGKIRLRRSSPNRPLPQTPKGEPVSASSASRDVAFWDLGTIADLIKNGLPNDNRLNRCGVYKITAPPGYVPRFIPPDEVREKGNVIAPGDLASLESKWVSKTDTVYIGLAGDGSPRSLRKRLDELLKHAQWQTTDRGPHKGGEIVWQLHGYDQFHLWAAQTGDPPVPRQREKTLLRQFTEAHGSLPFANRRLGNAAPGASPDAAPDTPFDAAPDASYFRRIIPVVSLIASSLAGVWLYSRRKI